MCLLDEFLVDAHAGRDANGDPFGKVFEQELVKTYKGQAGKGEKSPEDRGWPQVVLPSEDAVNPGQQNR